MSNLLIKNCNLGDKQNTDILIKNGVIAEISDNLPQNGFPEIDAKNYFVTSPFIDSHFHMDATLSYGLPRINKSGTLLEGIQLWGELKPTLTKEAIKVRAKELCKWAIARGTLSIRSHVDVSGDNLLAVESLLEIREEMKELIEGRFIDYGDKRITDILKGYVLQGIFYQMLGDTFCESKVCRLFNSHWQEEVINSQMQDPEFCEKHVKRVSYLKEIINPHSQTNLSWNKL